MKSWILFVLLSVFFNCLQTKKSGFDLKQGGLPGIFLFGVSSGLISLGSSASSDKTAPTVTVTNLKTKGTVETGILMGTSADNVAVSKVEIQLNSGSYQTATGTTSWTYKLPTTGWTGGNTNTINIKVTDTSGNVGTASLSTLTKGLNSDVNGDGYNDIAVGAYGYNSNQGRVYVFSGSANGVTDSSAANAGKIFNGYASAAFGKNVLMADFNNDGYGDLLVCSSVYTSSNNRGDIYYGSATGLSSTPSLTFSPPSGSATQFCYTIAAADFNSDGYLDLAISDGAVNPGIVYVYYGSSNGLSTTQSISIVDGSTTNEGVSMSAGDINGDGFPDLVMSNSIDSTIYIRFGSASGLGAASTSFTGLLASQNVSLADLNGDGKQDLILGDPSATSGASQGKVAVYLANGTTFNSTASVTLDGDSSQYRFGSFLLGRDINGDGINDLIISSDRADLNSLADSGAVYIFNGCASTVICNGSGGATAKSNLRIAGDSASLNLGSSVKVKDLNNDGFPELIITAVAGPGQMYIFQGSSAGFTATSNSSSSKTIAGQSTGSQFGASIN